MTEMLRCIALTMLAAGVCACAHRQDARLWVRHLVFHGVRHVDERELRRELSTEETSHFSFLHTKTFDPFALRLDVARIENYYRARGFFDVRVLSTDVNPADRRNAVNVEINVDEGVATKLAEVKVKGLDTLGDDAKPAVKNLDLRRGQIFDEERYLGEKGEMRQRLKTLGYAWADVDGQVQVDRDKHLATVEMHVDPGPKAYIRNVDLAGGFNIEKRLVLRHSLLRPGQLLTPEALEQARAKLYNLGLFSTVRVDYHHNAFHSEQADVQVTVSEGPLNLWRLGAGVSLELSRMEIDGRAEYTRNYFLGGLRRFILRAQPAYVMIPTFWQPIRQGPAATLEAELDQLDLFLTPDELRALAGYDLGLEYAFQYHGPRAHLGYAKNIFHDRLLLGIAYDFQYALFFSVDPALLSDPSRSAKEIGYVDPYRVGWVDESVVLDLRDQPLDAHQGGLFTMHGEEGGIWSGGAFDYEKFTVEARGYYSLFHARLVIAARTLFGQIWVQGPYGSPTTRRFYLGGPETFRGFNFNRLSLQIPSGNAGAPSLPIGGDEMFVTQLELRVRTVRLFGAWLEAAGFLDAGDVGAPTGQPFSRVDLSDLHFATGAGLRYKTSVGTIRADVGVRLNRLSAFEPSGRPNPDPGQPVAFHLSIGEPF